MRKAINGLCLIVAEDFLQNPGSGAIYVFCNQAKDKLKILYWDGNGFFLLYKRLEKGRFQIPKQEDPLAISQEKLRWLLQGIDFKKLPKPQILSVKTYA